MLKRKIMKKKLMMVAALLGVLTLGACVDDNESASVTAIREAKAAQLQSVAAMNNAQAEATTIISQAEAAIKQAEAAYQQALADQQTLEVQKLQATLETDIAAAQANAEADLQRAQAALETARAELVAALDKVSNAEATRISELLVKADGVLTKLQTARQNKLDATALIAKLQAELIGTEDYVANQKRTYEEQIATQQALLDAYGEMEATITSREEALKAYNEANAEAQALLDVYSQKSAAYTQAENEVNAIAANRTSYALYQAIADGTIQYGWYTSENIFDPEETNLYNRNMEYTFEDGTVGTRSWSIALVNYVINQEAIDLAKEAANTQVRIATVNLEDAQEALATKKLSGGYQDALKDVERAERILAAAETAADIQQAQNDLDAARATLAGMTYAEESAVENAETALETAQENLADVTEAETLLTGDAAKAYAALVEEYKAAWTKACEIAYVENENAVRAWSKQNTLATSLQNVANAYTDFESLISGCNQQIATLQGQIAALNDVDDKNEAIAKEQEKLAKAEQDIAIYEAQYNEYMALVQSLIETSAE